MRSRQRSQAVVEFGIIALLFTLLMFAVVDFGMLLNTWLAVSSGSRDIARSAAVGKNALFLTAQASKLNLPSVSAAGFGGKLCCDAASAVEVTVEYFHGSQPPGPACAPWTAGCVPIPVASIDSNYPAFDLGSCPANCGGCSPGPACRPVSDDLVRLTVIAHGAQIITPLVRPFFGCTNSSNPNCYVQLSSATTMRYEGAEF
jgi:hypothetical protein